MTLRTRKINFTSRRNYRLLTKHSHRAEYILEAIGAGATASTDTDWYKAWKESPEASRVQDELAAIHAEGRNKPATQARHKSDFSTTWLYQMTLLLQRDAQAHWRDPTYLLSKIALNIGSALLIGFSFYQADVTIQGTQNHLFVGVILSFH